MKRTVFGSRVGLLAAAAIALSSGSAAARFGVMVDGSPAFSLGTYLQTKGAEFQNGTGFNGRAALILGNFFLGYDYTQFGNARACMGSTCTAPSPADQGATKFHAFTAMYNIYFFSGAVKPYLALGLGAIFGTLGDWATKASANKVFGGDLRASFGLEIPFFSKFFLRVEGRYRYLVTNNPFQNLEQDVALGVLLGDVGAVARETIQDAHVLQAVVGLGAHF
jgi:hypothetical protein